MGLGWVGDYRTGTVLLCSYREERLNGYGEETSGLAYFLGYFLGSDEE
jgi:hypothetical protein